ncbi:hypothetical protein E1B28_011064 [Marasmius oreades]|uniref:THUMP domain-containing protein n=1 Tax=Marasmius oreades TaxID=181124 RepID=A0A9P7URP2_9AGAR|nr:uncharacterized protein E1B28_011064 [Marasmius oreades]KAG7089374.1 hypothetical protein E1B28_011064 [Marasmius oreades]
MDDIHSSSRDSARKKRKYLPGTSSARSVDGPGVWVSCVKGKEKKTVGELYDLFESLALGLWPLEGTSPDGSDSEENEGSHGEPLEDQISNEIAAMKKPRTEKRFVNCRTDTPCVVFISCKPPVDPVKLVETHIQNVQRTGAPRTRYIHRFVPVSGTCYTRTEDMQALVRKIISEYLARHPESSSTTYKIELRIRNHTSLTRPVIIKMIAECIPESLKVDLTDPQIFVLVEIFKSVCGIAITKDYYTLHKYNVMELATRNSGNEVGRV